MIRLRLLALLAGAGALLAGVPAVAQAAPRSPEAAALDLLTRAAQAASTRTWAGTQYVGTWRAGEQTSAVLEVSHRPGSGSTVRDAGRGDGAVVVPELDERLLRLLADHYDLAVAGTSRCVGRTAHVVEARRPGASGPAAVAGRFWLDTGSGLVLRREVYDGRGARLASSAFVDLQVEPAGSGLRTPGRRDGDPAAVLPRDGWSPPRALPGGLELFDARVRDHGRGSVLHLAYSDGLSTLSVFAQHGALPDEPGRGFSARQVRGTRAFVQPTAPERVVWQGDGRVFTLVSDAAPETVRAAVGALPRDPVPDDGVLARLGRGVARMGSWLNPFD